MNKLNRLNYILMEIKRLTLEVLKKALPILQELNSKDNNILDTLMETSPNINIILALKYLQIVSIKMLKDADTVAKEIENFTDVVILGEESMEKRKEEYPFLFQVWGASIYDDCGIDALYLLAEDIKNQLDTFNQEKIIKLALEQIEQE